ncbi:unnamed protein product [Rangifer tarandus platyrhynchus]|uniref:Uncharacterized protein n=1 Tax=Rangifer tarandus platyrhynchus TaxID=3082113 RepID=A0AC59YD37_RANTA
MAAFSKVFPALLPPAEMEGHKLCLYLGRGKLTIEVISQNSLTPSFSNLCLRRGGLQSPAAGLRGPRRPRLAPGAQFGPTAASPRAAPLPPPEPAGSPAGGRARKEPGAPRPPLAPAPPAGSRRPAAEWPSRAVPTRSFSNMSGSLPRRARVTGQRLVDYSRRRGRPPPPALHLRLRAYKCRCLVPGAAIGK